MGPPPPPPTPSGTPPKHHSKAYAFRELVAHLQWRKDVPRVWSDMLSPWLKEGALIQGFVFRVHSWVFKLSKATVDGESPRSWAWFVTRFRGASSSPIGTKWILSIRSAFNHALARNPDSLGVCFVEGLVVIQEVAALLLGSQDFSWESVVQSCLDKRPGPTLILGVCFFEARALFTLVYRETKRTQAFFWIHIPTLTHAQLVWVERGNQKGHHLFGSSLFWDGPRSANGASRQPHRFPVFRIHGSDPTK